MPSHQQIPTCLAESGRSLWESVGPAVDLSGHAAEILLLACKQADRAAEARRLLADSCIVAPDRFGQERAHPAVLIERQASAACAALISQIVGKATAAEAVDSGEEFFGGGN